MEQLVLFRKGIDTLTDSEYQQCILDFLQQSRLFFHRQTTLNLLFHAFHDDIKCDRRESVESMNGIISRIIISRKQQSLSIDQEDDDEDIDIAESGNTDSIKGDNLSLHHCSSRIISEISSYLSFRDKTQFESCSRCCFIGVRMTKNAVHHLDADDFTKIIKHCQSETDHFPSFQSIKAMTVNTKDVDKLIGSKHSVFFTSISSLEIRYHFPSELDTMFSVLSECSDLSRIQTLRLIQCEDEGALNSDSLSRWSLLFSRMQRMEYLEYSGYFEYGGVHFVDIDWMQRLCGLALNNLTHFGDEYAMMQRVFGALSPSKLTSFHQGTAIGNGLSDGVLDGVKELCLPWKQRDESIARLWTQRDLRCLKRVHFRNGHHKLEGESDSDSDCDSDIANDIESVSWNRLFIQKVLESVEYFSVDINGETDGVQIFEVLIDAMKQRENRLKLRVHGLAIENEGNLKDVMLRVDTLLTFMARKCPQWMLILADWSVLTMDSRLIAMMDKWCGSMQSTNHYALNIQKTEDKNGFIAKMRYDVVVCNEQCTINGIGERWLMTCQYCKGALTL